jgi:adenine-specific DNA-methyltransferase
MNKDQKITGNITPANKDFETLKRHFPQCFDKSGNLDFEKFKKQLSATEINFSKESYGMDWLGKSYARLLATDETTTLLKEDETFNQKPENANSENLFSHCCFFSKQFYLQNSPPQKSHPLKVVIVPLHYHQ